jgi:uncharacterized membrane protein
METKSEKFIRLAEKRTNSVIEKIRVLANCANPYQYEYSEKQIKQMFSAIEDELRNAKKKFSQQEQTDTNVFKFE